MAFDITVKHPQYESYLPAWRLMRDAFGGEDAIKAKGETYLPSKSGIDAISDNATRRLAYERYKMRAEFPDLVALTVRGSVGVALSKPAVIELPKELEPLIENATRDGLTLESMHRRITTEIMLMGRYGILPGIDEEGEPYLAGYAAESIINWDADAKCSADFVVLNEGGSVRDRATNKWTTVEKYRECAVEDGRYVSRVWVKSGSDWGVAEEAVALDGKGGAIDFLPMVFAGSGDLTPEPDDVPLHGLAKLALRVYRMDADLTTSLHMTSEPTPVVSGYEDPARAIQDGLIPKGIGASSLWVLPPSGDAKFLEFSGAGVQKQEDAIQKCYDRAVMFGVQMLSEQQRTKESGEAKRIRMDSQHATLKGIAMSSAAALEKALKNLAVWVGADPDDVSVTPNLEFFSQTLDGPGIDAIVRGWIEGAYSWQTAFERLKKGEVIPDDRTPEEERELIGIDDQSRFLE